MGLTLATAVAASKRISNISPLLSGVAMLAIFGLYCLLRLRSNNRQFERFSDQIRPILKVSEKIFWSVWLLYAVGGIGFGLYDLLR